MTLAFDALCQGTIIESGDEDYFKVTVAEAGVLVMTLDPVPTEVRMSIYLYNEQTDRITYTSYGDTGQPRTLEQLVGAGTYYIGLFGGTGDSSAEAYSFRVAFDTTDPNEVNNTFSDAASLGLGTPITGTIRSEGDEDYFKVIVSAAGLLSMTLDPVPSEVRMSIYLYNEQSERITYTFYGDAGQARVLEQAVEAGTYYIRLRGGSGDSSSKTYTFVASLN